MRIKCWSAGVGWAIEKPLRVCGSLEGVLVDAHGYGRF
jgi:hypothetical protein